MGGIHGGTTNKLTRKKTFLIAVEILFVLMVCINFCLFFVLIFVCLQPYQYCQTNMTQF